MDASPCSKAPIQSAIISSFNSSMTLALTTERNNKLRANTTPVTATETLNKSFASIKHLLRNERITPKIIIPARLENSFKRIQIN
jgi:hypothetical protein